MKSKNKQENNYAFIDSQNLNLSIQSLGWKLDFARFRIYLKEKYKVEKAFLFIGYIEGNVDLYKFLQSAGFICIFKPTLEYKDGTTKGNVDAELVLHTMIEYPNFDKAIIVSGDGDFYCLVKHLLEENKLKAVLVPNYFKYSALLKRFARKNIAFMNDLKKKLSYKKE
ncbi:NYN domain-containing protein [Patescibacteria group bacterium]|nr:NYN domain-containing protein [Patescibacteria group bacterium]